jgi:hypothetical protein
MKLKNTRDLIETVTEDARELATTAGHEIKGRASEVGDTARSATERARNVAVDQLVKVGVVEPPRRRRPPLLVRLVFVSAVVAGIVFVVRSLRSPAAAGDDTATGEAEGPATPPAATGNGEAAPSQAGSGRAAR